MSFPRRWGRVADVLTGSSYAHVARQYGIGRQRVLAIVRRACRQANPEAFAELARLSVPPYYTVPLEALRRDAGRLIAAMGQAGGAAISVAKTAQRVAPLKEWVSATALGNPMADFQRGCREGQWSGEANADAVSTVIVEQVWRRLQGSA